MEATSTAGVQTVNKGGSKSKEAFMNFLDSVKSGEVVKGLTSAVEQVATKSGNTPSLPPGTRKISASDEEISEGTVIKKKNP